MPWHFGPFTLDLEQRRLLRDGGDVPLTPKAFELLKLLVQERPKALGKDDIFSAIWKGVFVSDNTLATIVRDLRRALDDSARQPRYIRTAYDYGYAFIGDVIDAPAGRTPNDDARWVLFRGGLEMPLAAGEHILGRSGQGVIAIDSPTVSRHHARLTVHADRVTCQDLGSKNGTWVGGEPATTPLDVQDGAEVRLGSVVVIIRAVAGLQSTETVAPRPN